MIEEIGEICLESKHTTTMTAVKKVEEATDTDLGALLDAGDGAIVTLVAGDTRLAAYRAVLAARSSVFSTMFSHDTLDARSGQVTIPDVDGPVLRQLLAYLYTLRVPQVPGMILQLLPVADKYCLSGLKAECEQRLAAQLTVENAATVAVLAVRHSCPRLTEAAIAFIRAHTHQVMGTKNWADAVFNHPKDLVEVSLLLAKPPIEIRSLSGEEKSRMLIKAAQQGDVEELKTLLAVGANVGASGDSTMTALHCAAEGGHLEAVRCLLEGGAPVDARTSWGSMPLHYAAQNGHVAVLQLLLASSSDPNARGSRGATPLHYAAKHGHTEVVAALLGAGADKGIRDDDGKSPLDYAKEKRRRLIEKLT